MMQLHNTDGFKFYRSANDVILCPGDENGLLPPKYFSEVRALPSGRIEVILWFLKQKKSPQLLSKKDFTYILLDLEFTHHSWHLILFLLTPVLFHRLIHLYQPVLFHRLIHLYQPQSCSQTHSLVPTPVLFPDSLT